MTNNHIYALIKDQAKEFYEDDIVSFFQTFDHKKVKIQLGGYENQNARGYKNGVRFYEQGLEVANDGKAWLLPVQKLVISKEKGKKW